MVTTAVTGGGELIAIIGYAFAIFLWKQGYKVYALIYSLIWTNALLLFMPVEYHGIIWFLVWMNAGILLFHIKLIKNRLNAMFHGRGGR